MRCVEEANLLMSLQGRVAVEVNVHLADHCLRHAARDGRVLDVGCWSGGLSTFLAAERPDLNVVGADRLHHLVTSTSARHALPNLSFVTWDYGAGPLPGRRRFDQILCGMGIDFNQCLPRYYSLDASNGRDCQGHAVSRAEVLPHFRHWRAAAKRGARLLLVLRIPCFAHGLAIVDAASDAGWSLRLTESGWLEVADERFPALSFHAGPARRVEEENLLAWWVRGREGDEEGDAALLRYRRLGRKKVVRERGQRYADGHVVRREVGTVEGTGYALTHATTGYCRIRQIPTDQAANVVCDFQM